MGYIHSKPPTGKTCTIYGMPLTHLDWSQMRDRKVWASSLRRTSVEQAQATCVKHSAHAFLTPHTPSSHRKQNLGSWNTANTTCLLN